MAAPLSQLTAMLDERFHYPARRDKTKDRRITPVRDDVLGPMQPALLATLGATALILLIGCANVAALVLGQVDARSAEFAVRSALGANRHRLAQQLIVEVLIVATVAGTRRRPGVGRLHRRHGCAPARCVGLDRHRIGACSRRLWRSPSSRRRSSSSCPSSRSIAATCAACLSAARTGGIEGRGGRLESGLVIAQVALAVMIASGAALLARSVANMYAVQPGVRVDGVAVVDMVFEGTLDRASREKMLNELERALRELPGVASVGAAQTAAAARRRLQGGAAHRRTPGHRGRGHRVPNRDARLSRERRHRPSPGARDRDRETVAKPSASSSSTRRLPRPTSRASIPSAGRSPATSTRDARASSASWQTPLKNV